MGTTRPDPPPTPAEAIDALRARLGARAAGWWRVAGGVRLEQVAFAAAADMDPAVALGFADATRSVPLDQTGLGIVRAAATGAPAASRVADLPAGTGSGLWLRRFAAARSVAVPVPRGEGGDGVWVVAVALASDSPDDAAVAAAVRSEAEGWPAV